MSILEVAAFKSIDLALQVCEGVADLSPATYLEKTICMQVGPKKVRLLSGELLDAFLFRSNCNETDQLGEFLSGVNVGHPLLSRHARNAALKVDRIYEYPQICFVFLLSFGNFYILDSSSVENCE